MSMYTLQDALLSDPDLETIPEEQRAKTIQALFALTGCDFTSFFSGLGKVTFFNTFMKNARFIVGTDSLPGDLTDNVLQQRVLWLLQDWLVVHTSASIIPHSEEHKHPLHSIIHYNKVALQSTIHTVSGYQP